MAARAEAQDKVFHGTVIHATHSRPLEIWENAILGVRQGKVVFLDHQDRLQERLRQHELDAECIVKLDPKQLLMPGLVDCHLHSPQLPIQGVGTDRCLLDWLTTYTLPVEARCSDPHFAHMTHDRAVRRTLRGGTTLACYYATIHTDSSLLLCQAADQQGQRALVGKVNMDTSSPDYYIETTQQSIAETEKFIQEALSYKSGLITPIITPRFALSCSQQLMASLGQMAQQYNLPVQTHMSENLHEVATVLKQNSPHKTYSDIYDAAGLLGPKTVLAHCIHISDAEIYLLKSRGCGLVHCACSNTTLRSGMMDTRRLLDRGVKLGLGTDIGGGYSPSMLATMRHTVDVSNMCAIRWEQDGNTNHLKDGNTNNLKDGNADHITGGSTNHFKDGNINHVKDGNTNNVTSPRNTPPAERNGGMSSYQQLTMAEAFRLATLYGSDVLGQNCGNFQPGKEFDGLVIDPEVKDSPLDLFPFDTTENIIQKFFYTGDDRNITRVYVQGRQVVSKSD